MKEHIDSYLKQEIAHHRFEGELTPWSLHEKNTQTAYQYIMNHRINRYNKINQCLEKQGRLDSVFKQVYEEFSGQDQPHPLHVFFDHAYRALDALPQLSALSEFNRNEEWKQNKLFAKTYKPSSVKE